MIRERVMAGLARARKEGKVLGRPKSSGATEAAILKLRGEGKGMLSIAKALGVGTSVVQRVLKAA
jgi:DNA invertase Pin-like site-specific DNA recombinase